MKIDGIGENNYNKYSKLLGKNNVRIIDLLWHFPQKIIQRDKIQNISQLIDGEIGTVNGKIIKYIRGFKNRPHQFLVDDGTDILELLYFRMPFYMAAKIKIGDNKYISGKVSNYNNKKQIAHPDFILSSDDFDKRRNFEPIYPLTNGLTNYNITSTFEKVFRYLENIDDWYSQEFLEENNWLGLLETFREIHIPTDDYFQDEKNNFIKRLAYDEILINQIKIEHIRKIRSKLNGISIKSKPHLVDKIKNTLQFKLSPSQENAIKDIFVDMEKPHQMIRLLQGDVGSGKTLVSFFAGLKCIESNYQFALLAPTEILAKQHYKNFQNFIKGLNFEVCLLTSNISNDERLIIIEKIKTGKIHAIIGTHSIFQENIIYKNLGLIVIDEQHRFGVHQRLSLQKKSTSGRADLLLMTATPIPRTLIQTKYGDIELSELQNLPNRKKIQTNIVSLLKIDELVQRLQKKINKNNKVFWVCPQILSNENNRTSVIERYHYLRKYFRNNMSLIHGKMSEENKNNEINKYLSDETNLLVATSVIEVGIDIKQANIIVIENANLFGLSQIHQLRGRVGRNDNKSWCVLLHDNNLTEIAKDRLKIIKENNDGFQIAREDMLLRGFGDVLGNRQSGFSNYHVLNEELILELTQKASNESSILLEKILTDKKERTRYKYLFDFYEAHEFKYIIT